MRVAAYLRVSTDRQAEEGMGLDVQRHAIRAWAKAGGHSVKLWAADEGQSGSNGLDTRHGLYEAMGALQDGTVQGIVVYKLDRLARDLVLQEQLLAEAWRMGGRVYSTSAGEDAFLSPDGAEDDPSRALIRRILGAVSDYERSMIKLRMRSGKARKREQGGFIGGQVPFGFRSEGGALVPDASEYAALQRILALRSEGASLRAICSALEADGAAPKRGTKWHSQSVLAILRRHGRS